MSIEIAGGDGKFEGSIYPNRYNQGLDQDALRSMGLKVIHALGDRVLRVVMDVEDGRFQVWGHLFDGETLSYADGILSDACDTFFPGDGE